MNKSFKTTLGIIGGMLFLILVVVSTVIVLNRSTDFEPFQSGKSYNMYESAGSNISYDYSNQLAAADKVITSNSLNIESKNIRKAVNSIDNLVAEFGAKYTSKSIDTGDAQYGYLTIKVPSDNAQAFVDRINKDYDVSSYNTDISDMTEQYYDREKDIEDLKAKIKLYKDLEKQVPISNIEQRITIIDKVSSLERQIHTLQEVNENIDNRIEYRDITITLSAPGQLVGERNYWHNVAQAIISTLQNSLKVLVVLIAMAIPFGLLIGIVLIIKRLRR